MESVTVPVVLYFRPKAGRALTFCLDTESKQRNQEPPILLREEPPAGPRVGSGLSPPSLFERLLYQQVLGVDVHEQRGLVRGIAGGKPSAKALWG